MKKTLMILAVLLTASVFLSDQLVNAQSPNKMSYQAVIRDPSNNLVPDHSIGMRVSILKDESVTPVYVETHVTKTNANGLVNIEIGTGIVTSGNFAIINWANGVYFIKTETDPAGGTKYSITSTSQLLSVPYALHSKTAEALTNGFTETDPIFGVWNKSTGISITASQVSDFQTSVTNNTAMLANTAKNSYPSADATKLAGIAAGAEVNVKANWNATSGDAQILNKPTIAHSIGESYGGGVVFYVYDGGQHGLIARKFDQSSMGISWWAGDHTYTMARANGVGAGKANTAIIIANQGDGVVDVYAARICNEYSVAIDGVTYGDWYLPSKFELNLLYLERSAVGGFVNAFYWSSTEYNSFNAYYQNFSSGFQSYNDKINKRYVRAIRAF